MMKIRPFVLIHLLIPALLWSQEDSTFKLNVNVDLTELHVSVTDEKDRPVGSLKMENFHVFEDQTQQKLTVFKHEDIPVSLGLVIDNSRSMEPRKQRLDAAALSAVRKSNPEDESFIVHFDDTARLDSDFTNSISRLEETLASVKPYGQTAIYDALILKPRDAVCEVAVKKSDPADDRWRRQLQQTHAGGSYRCNEEGAGGRIHGRITKRLGRRES